MPDEHLISFAQNGEDIVLWRALGHLPAGIFVDVGGWDPDVDSVTRLFYERGWRGIDVEPVPEMAEKFRERRPLDEVVQAAITDVDAETVVLHRFGSTGLTTLDDEFARTHASAGLEHEDISVPARRLDDVLAASSLIGETIHFLKIDVEGAEDQVLRSLTLDRWRPWVLVIEATEPNSTVSTHDRWEPSVLAAGYRLTLFDGLSRFYVSPDHPELAESLGYAACVLDGFQRAAEVELRATLEAQEQDLTQAREQSLRWRREAVGYWANAVARVQKSEDEATKARGEAAKLRTQLARTRDRLREARDDRKRLRARVQRMAARIEGLEQSPPEMVGVRDRVRAGVKRVTGA